MLVKHIQRKVGLLRPSLYFTTTSQLSQSTEPENDEVKPSKLNPNGEADLRGNENV